MQGGFKIKSKNKKENINIEIFQGKLNHCKLSKQNFRGACCVKGCHANLPVNEEQCLYIFYPGKDEFDKLDVQYALNFNDKSIREQNSLGKFNSFCCISLKKILTIIKDNSKITYQCSKCGVVKKTNGDCINNVECTKRKNYADYFIANSYLSFPEMKANCKDLFQLLYNKQKIQKFIDECDTEVLKPNLSHIFGVSEDIIEQMNEIKCIL